MPYTVAVSEFTDINNTDWKVKVVSSVDPGSIDLPFNLGPDGFNLNYDFDEYDRCKPVVGSRVQITLYHPIPNTTTLLYILIDRLAMYLANTILKYVDYNLTVNTTVEHDKDGRN